MQGGLQHQFNSKDCQEICAQHKISIQNISKRKLPVLARQGNWQAHRESFATGNTCLTTVRTLAPPSNLTACRGEEGISSVGIVSSQNVSPLPPTLAGCKSSYIHCNKRIIKLDYQDKMEGIANPSQMRPSQQSICEPPVSSTHGMCNL